ncbi:CGLAU_01105 family protein [Corynebacterium urinipleomorphum]|uniref:CGLAU_01105 family protein n=1 Tax=Corynebacterium urinipleomorphum TaxID=1852380 RepID=UPI000B350D4F|nr:CGLAU_01105 family protein [Corynebacterium urinipleomorphum]
MTDRTGNASKPNYSANNNGEESILNTLKGAGEASLNAWSRLGDLAGEFGRNFRADRDADISGGAHAAHTEDLTDDHAGFGDQFKAAIANARQAYEGAENDRDFRAATASLAGDAESIFRDFAGSVTRAADTARESDEADKMKSAFRDAADEVRESFNVAVNQMRNRGGEAGAEDTANNTASGTSSAEDTIADMRSRLDDMINRLGSVFSSDEPAPTDTSAGRGTASDIIDGEVVEDNGQSNPDPKNS